MSQRRVVVDGSNIATEGRSIPSLKQLDEAVRAYKDEHPDDEVLVVVDATFAHRIDESEREEFEEAAAHNELVYPPAGAVGRGDAFLLRIAERTGAVVLSNDSFQEFHGEHEWLFEKGRLVGGTPVPGVGWIFVERTPVRGPKSRQAVTAAKRARKAPKTEKAAKTRKRGGRASKEASTPMPVPSKPPPRRPAKEDQAVKEAIDEATDEAVHPDEDGDSGGRRRRRRRRKTELPSLNEPLTFISFIAEHKLGGKVQGTVESFSSHGAFVIADGARCYVPLSAMGDPPPRSAREVLNKGETREFVLQALDAPRRGIELAIPGFEHVAGQPTEETVEAEIDEVSKPARKAAKKKATAKKTAAKKTTKKASAKKTAAKKAAAKKTPAKKTPAKKTTAKKTTAKKTTGKKTTAKKTAAKKAPAKKTAAKKAAAKKTTGKKSAAKKTAGKKTGAKKSAARKSSRRTESD